MTTLFKWIKPCLWVSLTTVFLLLTGCQFSGTIRMYEGSDLPAEQLATLIVPYCVVLNSVDNAYVPMTAMNETRVLLKPGAHLLKAHYEVIYPLPQGRTQKIVSKPVLLTFTGEAGKTYSLCCEDPDTFEATQIYAAHAVLWIENGRVKPGFGHPPVQPSQHPEKPAETTHSAAP